MASVSSISPARNLSGASVGTAASTTTDPTETRRQPPVFTLVRDVPLPVGSVMGQVDAIQRYYQRLTGMGLDFLVAVQTLDQLIADRPTGRYNDPRPIPVELASIAAWMVQNGYNDDAIYLTIREIERTGTAMLSVSLNGEDREQVDALVPPAVRGRGRFEAWA